jgi:hypothetical protein
MDKVKNITKSGWHPSGKDGKKESWRGDFKGINQVVRFLIFLTYMHFAEPVSLNLRGSPESANPNLLIM